MSQPPKDLERLPTAEEILAWMETQQEFRAYKLETGKWYAEGDEFSETDHDLRKAFAGAMKAPDKSS